MATPTGAASASASPELVSRSSLTVDVGASRSRAVSSVTGRLKREASLRFPQQTVKNQSMDKIADETVALVWKDAQVQEHQREGKALGVMKGLLADAGTTYPDSALVAAIQKAAQKALSAKTDAAATEGAGCADRCAAQCTIM